MWGVSCLSYITLWVREMGHKLFKELSFLAVVALGVLRGDLGEPPYYYMYLCGVLIAIDRVYSKLNN